MAGRRKQSLEEFAELVMPEEAAEPILARPVRGALLDWLTEIWASEDLRAVGLEPRRRAVFYGPPGTGKTTLAHHLSARLGLPMAIVRADRIVERWMGATGQNIGALFDAARAAMEAGEPVVLFFDEFDSLALTRRRAEGTAAMDDNNQSVNILLSCIDAFPGFIIAATNRAEGMDQAVWRRFDMQIEIDLPGQPEREAILARYFAPYVLPAENLRALAEAMETASPALMRQFAEGVKRQLVVGPRAKWNMTREAVIGRVLASVAPHPDLGKPRLWSKGTSDIAVRWLVWPLAIDPDTEDAAA